MTDRQGFLLLEDGTLFLGRLVGPEGPTVAEVVFTTNMSGYQEVFTDPSYQGQIVVMTAPQIGNYGVNTEDPESSRPQVSGIIVRELSATYSNWRATGGLRPWLVEHGVPALTEVDTRRLTRHLRARGVMRGVMAPATESRTRRARAKDQGFIGDSTARGKTPVVYDADTLDGQTICDAAHYLDHFDAN